MTGLIVAKWSYRDGRPTRRLVVRDTQYVVEESDERGQWSNPSPGLLSNEIELNKLLNELKTIIRSYRKESR